MLPPRALIRYHVDVADAIIYASYARAMMARCYMAIDDLLML